MSVHVKTDCYRFFVFGGDLRQVYLAKTLALQGHTVTVYGLCAPVEAVHGRMTTKAETFAEAAEASDIFLCPTPFFKGGQVFCQNPDVRMNREVFFGEDCAGKLLFAGCIPADVRERLHRNGTFSFDLMLEETVAVRNSIATAEGAIAEALIHSPYNLSGSRCLILGYGRCGAALASLLKGISRKITVCARSPLARAKASVCADEVMDFRNLYRALKRSEIIFNTIPCEILNRHMVKHISPDALIVDLASAPGGVDCAAAEECGIRTVFCPGLPGKYSPASSAEILAGAVLKILSERDCPAYAGGHSAPAGAPAD